MKKIIIIGAGPGGFWSAISAVRQSREIKRRSEVEIALVNSDNYIRIRPKLNQISLEAPRIELAKYMKPLGVHQTIGRVATIRPGKSEITISTGQGSHDLYYDYLILAAGTYLKEPDLPGIHHTFKVDSYPHAQRLEDHLFDLARNDFRQDGASTFVVVGSGFQGLEAVTAIEQKVRAIQAYHAGKEMNFRIVMLESYDQKEIPLSNECLQYIRDILTSRNVEVLPKPEILAIETASILLEDGKRLSTRTVIWTEGLLASPLTKCFEGDKDHRNRLLVDNFLKLPSYSNVIAAGSIANTTATSEGVSAATGRYAQFEGRWAGHNAVNDLYGIRMKEYVAPVGDPCVDLGDSQTFYLTDWQQNLKTQRDRQRAAERRMNTVSMFPWQDVEETVKSSYPEFPRY